MPRRLALTCALLGLTTIALVGPSANKPDEPARTSQTATSRGGSDGLGARDLRMGKQDAETAQRSENRRNARKPAAGRQAPGVRDVGMTTQEGAPASGPNRAVNGPRRDSGRPSGSREPVTGPTDGAAGGDQGGVTTRQVALTFDDGPDPVTTPQILELLKGTGVKATFCVIGVKVRTHPELVRQIVADGHTLCNHSWSHDLNLGAKGLDAIHTDLEQTTAEIRKVVPDVAVRYFRHPGGNFTTSTDTITKGLGMVSLGWNVDPRDWDTTKYQTNGQLTEHIVSVVSSQCHPGAIVLSHDGGGDRTSTIAAYRQLLPSLKTRFELVALPT